MPRIFQVVKKVVDGGGGPPVGGSEGLLVEDDLGDFEVGTAESNATPSDTESFVLDVSDGETSAAQSETHTAEVAAADEPNASQVDAAGDLEVSAAESAAAQSSAETFDVRDGGESNGLLEVSGRTLTVTGYGDSNVVQAEGRSAVLRYWAAASSDNDAGRTNPSNANGPPNGTYATVRTALDALSTTNPVVLTSTSFNVPTSGPAVSDVRLRLFFRIPARTATLDTITLDYSFDGTTWTAAYTHSGTAQVDFLTSGRDFDVAGVDWTQFSTLRLRARYQAAVVSTPETRVDLDGWCVEFHVTI